MKTLESLKLGFLYSSRPIHERFEEECVGLQYLREEIASLPFKKAVIEGGHFYVDHRLSPVGEDDYAFSKIGQYLAVKVGNASQIPCNIWWFIDDIHGDHDLINGSRCFIENNLDGSSIGFHPNVVIRESEEDLHKEALSLVEQIPDEYLLNLRKGVSLKRDDRSNYILCHKDRMKNLIDPNCCLLDAALYRRKWESMGKEGVCITILPERSGKARDQQTTTSLILEKAGTPIPILNIYFDHHQITYDRNY